MRISNRDVVIFKPSYSELGIVWKSLHIVKIKYDLNQYVNNNLAIGTQSYKWLNQSSKFSGSNQLNLLPTFYFCPKTGCLDLIPCEAWEICNSKSDFKLLPGG